MRLKVLFAATLTVATAAVSTTTPTVAAQPSEFTRCMMLAERGCKQDYPGDPEMISQCIMWAYNGECAGLDGDPRNDGQICWIIGGDLVCQPG